MTSPIMPIARAYCNNPSDIDDVAQELRIHEWKIRQSHPDKPQSYINTALRRKALDTVAPERSGGQRFTRQHLEFDPILDDVALPRDPDVCEVVRQAVRRLYSDRDRLMVYYRFWEDLEYTGIASRTGLTAGAVRNRFAVVIFPALRETLNEAL